MNRIITMKEAIFYIDEEKRTVVCVIPNTKHMAVDFINLNGRLSPDCDLKWGFYDSKKPYLSDQLLMPNKFTGKAVCAPEDVFDVNIGKEIAFYKARGKLYRTMFRKFNLFVNTVDKYLDDIAYNIDEFGVKLSKYEASREKYIQSLIDNLNTEE